MSTQSRDFRDVQEAFCAHLRDPKRNPAPDHIEPRRIQVYEGLFFRNMLATFRDFFPVITSLYSEGELERLVRSFYSRHQSHTPYFHRLGEEFVEYLTKEHEYTDADPSFLGELADYEWIGTSVRIHDTGTQEETIPFDSVDDPLDYPIVLNPHHALRMYTYPVHRIGPECQPTEEPDAPTFLLIFRTPEKTRHMELSVATARLIQLLEMGPDIPARTHMETVAREIPQVPSEKVLEGGLEALSSLSELGAVSGCSSSSTNR